VRAPRITDPRERLGTAVGIRRRDVQDQRQRCVRQLALDVLSEVALPMLQDRLLVGLELRVGRVVVNRPGGTQEGMLEQSDGPEVGSCDLACCQVRIRSMQRRPHEEVVKLLPARCVAKDVGAEGPVVRASCLVLQVSMGLVLVGRHSEVASVEQRLHREKLLTGVSVRALNLRGQQALHLS